MKKWDIVVLTGLGAAGCHGKSEDQAAPVE
jgi:hypothetical protein